LRKPLSVLVVALSLLASQSVVVGAFRTAITIGAAGIDPLTLGHAGRASVQSSSRVDPGPTPRAKCGPGSRPETGRQGRVSQQDVDSGRAAKGFTCNTKLVGRFGVPESAGSGGYRTYRYVDKAGHECAFYDSTLLFPFNALTTTQLTGVYVLDMSNPAKPVKTANLLTPAMQSPHESLSFNPKRGLLGAVMGNPVFYPGVVDMYDVSQDCRQPVLKSSLPLALLGHEGNFAPDGRTYYATSVGGNVVTAVDVSDPSQPKQVWSGDFNIHGLSISDDGTRAYMADLGDQTGLTILDVSQIQKRVADPQVRVVSRLTWPEVSIPQTTIPITIKGHRYLVEIDEFSRGISTDPAAPVGAARIIDIANDRKPRVVSNIRLEVHMPKNRPSQMNDPGASDQLQGYAGHYCAVPKRHEPGIVACSFILSGLRVFDIRDPFHPKEIAYYNAPRPDSDSTNYAMSGPTFAPERGEVWYTDGNLGFYAVKVTNGVWPFH
jgi:hypothetical protein